MTDSSDNKSRERSGGGAQGAKLVLSIIGAVFIVAAHLGIWKWSHRVFGEPIGEPCADGGDCRTGECMSSDVLPFMVSGICTKTCARDDDCGEGNRCVPIATGRNCIPAGTRQGGEPCDMPWDCDSMRCVNAQVPRGSFGMPNLRRVGPGRTREARCADPCGPERSCPEGFACADIDRDELCVMDGMVSDAMIRGVQEMMQRRWATER